MHHESRKPGFGQPILIAAISGRALAVSARRAGYAPLVVDMFCDQDTIAAAQAHVRLTSGLARGMDGDELLSALQALALLHAPTGIVCGTGFEDRPQLLAQLAQRWTLIGNSAETIAMVKDPQAFAALCRSHGIPHPELSLVLPREPTDWLAKRRGGSGGTHIKAAQERNASEAIYFQRRVTGMPVSALFLADGRRAEIIGFSTQWASPTPQQLFRYGGAVRPADITPSLAALLRETVQVLVPAIPLIGLNSADFLVEDGNFWLMEINPRPSATLDIFEPPGGSLFALHVAACEGKLPQTPPRIDGAAAAAIAYAKDDIASLAPLQWPDWTADRPHAGVAVAAGEPLCTVRASGGTAAEAKALLNQRLAAVLAWTRAEM